MKTLILLCIVAALCGCSHLKENITSEVVGADGKVTERKTTRVSATEFFDSKQSIEKLRLSNGKTHSIGMSGFDGEASGTNAVRSLELLNDILGKLPK